MKPKAGLADDTTAGRTGLRSIIRNAAFLTGARLVTQFVRAIYILLIARLLGPELYGIFAYGQTWYVVFLPLIGFGLAGLITREIGRDRANAVALLEKTLLLSLLAGVAVSVLAALIAWHVEPRDSVRLLLLVFCLALLGRGLVMWTESVFTAYEKARYALAQQAVFRPLEVIVGVGLVLADFGLVALAVWHAVTWWLNAIVGLRTVHRTLCRLRLGVDAFNLQSIIVAILPLTLNSFAANWLIQGPLILYRYQPNLSDYQLGQFALPMQIVMVLAGLTSAFSLASIPVMSRSAHRRDGKDTRLIMAATRATILGGGLIGFIGLGIATPLTTLVFGTAYGEAGQLLGYAVWLMIPIMIGNLLMVSLIARNESWWLPTLSVLASISLVLVLPLMAHALGPMGVLLAAGLSLTGWVGGMYWRISGSTPMAVEAVIVKPTAALLIGALVFWLLADYGTAIAAVSAVAVMIAGALVLGAVSMCDLRAFQTLRNRRTGTEERS